MRSGRIYGVCGFMRSPSACRYVPLSRLTGHRSSSGPGGSRSKTNREQVIVGFFGRDGSVYVASDGSPQPFQYPPGCPSSPYGLCALVGSSSADNYELVRSCEHFIHTSTPPSRGLSGDNFPNFRPLVGLPTGSAASGPSVRIIRR